MCVKTRVFGGTNSLIFTASYECKTFCHSCQHGNARLRVYKKTSFAKNKILEGKGPQFIEFETYRHREHCGPNYDNTLGYREEKEFIAWKERDPLRPFFENDTDLDSKIVSRISKEIEEAHEFANKSKFPSEKDFLEILLREFLQSLLT